MAKTFVKKVTFDFFDGQEWHNGITIFDSEDDLVTDYEIEDEAGPWCMKSIGGTMYDFQIYTDPDNGLMMQAQTMQPSSTEWNGKLELCWSHDNATEFYNDCFRNIKVEYKSVEFEEDEDFVKRTIKESVPTYWNERSKNAFVDAIYEEVWQDVVETADPEEWNSSDVEIAVRRVLFHRLGLDA